MEATLDQHRAVKVRLEVDGGSAVMVKEMISIDNLERGTMKDLEQD